MIKSRSSVENKILLLFYKKNENTKIDNKQQIYHRKNKTIKNKGKKEDENEEKRTPTRRNKIKSIGKISSKMNEYFIKKDKENNLSKSLNNKNKDKRKITQLKIYDPNQTKSSFCNTERSTYKNESIQHTVNDSTPKKNNNIFFRNKELNLNKTPKYNTIMFTDFNQKNKKCQHRRNKSDLKHSFSEFNANIFLTTQNFDNYFTKKNSEESNYIIKETDEPSDKKGDQNPVSDSYEKGLNTERDRSFNDSSLKELYEIKLDNYKTNKNKIKILKSNNTFILEPRQVNEHKFYNAKQKDLFFLRRRNNSYVNNIAFNQYNTLLKQNEKPYNNKYLNKTFYGSKSKSNIKDSKNKLNATFCESYNNVLKSSKKNIVKNIKRRNKSLEPILENEKYHYLEDTICTRNKMVKKTKNILDDYPTLQKVRALLEKKEIKGRERLKALDKSKKKINKYNESPSIKTDTKIKVNNLSVKKNNYINNRNRCKQKKYGITNRAASMDKTVSNLTTLSNTPLFNGKIEDYLITKELGKGSYAVVKLAKHRITKEKYAIKIYTKESLLDPQKRNTVKNEINILKQLNHMNIMKLYEVIDTSKYLYLVLEYIKGYSLLDLIKSEKMHYIEQHRALKLFLQIVKGISYCQSKNINHRDIKLENILVIKDDIIKIIDFGFAVKGNKETYQKLFCGTPSYMPPEIVNKEKYIAQYSDIWSLGVLLYTMLYGRFPFKAKDDETLFELINEAKVKFPENISVNENIKALIKKLLNVDPKLRPSPEDIINEIIYCDI